PASNVASYDITAAPSSDPAGKVDNYDVTVNKGKLTVTRAPLTIDVASKSREYGEANPGLTGTVGGLKNGDVVDPSYSTTATLSTGIGPHDITASPGPANVVANYDVTVNKGTLTITPAPLAAKADDKTKGYGDTNPTFTGVLTGVKNGEAVTLDFPPPANAA